MCSTLCLILVLFLSVLFFLYIFFSFSHFFVLSICTFLFFCCSLFICFFFFFFFSSRRRHTRCLSDWSSDVCSSDLIDLDVHQRRLAGPVLPEQSMDLARSHVEVDTVVRHDGPEALSQAAYAEQ